MARLSDLHINRSSRAQTLGIMIVYYPRESLEGTTSLSILISVSFIDIRFIEFTKMDICAELV